MSDTKWSTQRKTDGGKGDEARLSEDNGAYREGYARIFGERNGLSEKDNNTIENMIDKIKQEKAQ